MTVTLEMDSRDGLEIAVARNVDAAKDVVRAKAKLWQRSKPGRKAKVDEAGLSVCFYFSDGKLYGGMYIDPLPPPHDAEPFDNRRRPDSKSKATA